MATVSDATTPAAAAPGPLRTIARSEAEADATFHDRLRAATEQAHDEAEQSCFIRDLMSGALDKAAYLDYLVSIEGIYDDMERVLRSRGSGPLLTPFDDRRLDRAAAIAHDIRALVAEIGPRPEAAHLPAVARYRGHLTSGLTDVQLLASHYIRYLGDLSGGQVIARLVTRHYDLSADQLTFYDFSDLGDPVQYKRSYREALNRSRLGEDERAAFVSETITLYRLTTAVFGDLDSLPRTPAPR